MRRFLPALPDGLQCKWLTHCFFCLTFHSYCLKIYSGFFSFFLDKDEKLVFIMLHTHTHANASQESCDAVVQSNKEKITLLFITAWPQHFFFFASSRHLSVWKLPGSALRWVYSHLPQCQVGQKGRGKHPHEQQINLSPHASIFLYFKCQLSHFKSCLCQRASLTLSVTPC